MSNIQYDRDILVDTLVHHQRKDIQYCTCGWGVFGMSHAGHIANVYEAAVRRKNDQFLHEHNDPAIRRVVYESMIELLQQNLKEGFITTNAYDSLLNLNQDRYRRSTKDTNEAYLRRMLDEGKITVTRIDTDGEDDGGMRIELLVDPE